MELDPAVHRQSRHEENIDSIGGTRCATFPTPGDADTKVSPQGDTIGLCDGVAELHDARSSAGCITQTPTDGQAASCTAVGAGGLFGQASLQSKVQIRQSSSCNQVTFEAVGGRYGRPGAGSAEHVEPDVGIAAARILPAAHQPSCVEEVTGATSDFCNSSRSACKTASDMFDVGLSKQGGMLKVSTQGFNTVDGSPYVETACDTLACADSSPQQANPSDRKGLHPWPAQATVSSGGRSSSAASTAATFVRGDEAQSICSIVPDEREYSGATSGSDDRSEDVFSGTSEKLGTHAADTHAEKEGTTELPGTASLVSLNYDDMSAACTLTVFDCSERCQCEQH